MYAFGRWDEERVIQGLAVLMCLAMVGMAVMPVTVGACKIGNYILFSEKYGAWQKTVAATDMAIATFILQDAIATAGGFIALAASGPVGAAIVLTYVGILL